MRNRVGYCMQDAGIKEKTTRQFDVYYKSGRRKLSYREV